MREVELLPLARRAATCLLALLLALAAATADASAVCYLRPAVAAKLERLHAALSRGRFITQPTSPRSSRNFPDRSSNGGRCSSQASQRVNNVEDAVSPYD
jgi:hypothetical protein